MYLNLFTHYCSCFSTTMFGMTGKSCWHFWVGLPSISWSLSFANVAHVRRTFKLLQHQRLHMLKRQYKKQTCKRMTESVQSSSYTKLDQFLSASISLSLSLSLYSLLLFFSPSLSISFTHTHVQTLTLSMFIAYSQCEILCIHSTCIELLQHYVSDNLSIMMCYVVRFTNCLLCVYLLI